MIISRLIRLVFHNLLPRCKINNPWKHQVHSLYLKHDEQGICVIHKYFKCAVLQQISSSMNFYDLIRSEWIRLHKFLLSHDLLNRSSLRLSAIFKSLFPHLFKKFFNELLNFIRFLIFTSFCQLLLN